MARRTQKDDEIRFLQPGSSFRFRCMACGRCCGEFRIVLSPYDIHRLSRATGFPTTELRARGIVQIKRESFKKVSGFAPIADLFELFGLPENDSVPVATLAFRNKERGKHVCEFLAAPRDGKRLCTIYEDRPSMCRLHPLGCVTIQNKRRWFFRQPLCDRNDGPEYQVSQWVRESGARPFLAANGRFLKWIRQLLSECENLASITEDHWELLEQIWYDIDSLGHNRKTYPLALYGPDHSILSRKGNKRGAVEALLIDELFRSWLIQAKLHSQVTTQ